jgi:hypothetical protein
MMARSPSSPLMGEVARGVAARRSGWRLDVTDFGAVTHSVIALARADSSPIKGEQGFE